MRTVPGGLSHRSTKADQNGSFCPHCGHGHLVLHTHQHTVNNERQSLWHCDNPDCGYAADDHQGKPLPTVRCDRCGRQLRLITGTTAFWACSGWYDRFNECRRVVPDEEGRPAW